MAHRRMPCSGCRYVGAPGLVCHIPAQAPGRKKIQTDLTFPSVLSTFVSMMTYFAAHLDEA
jgi:hypothetical protein